MKLIFGIVMIFSIGIPGLSEAAPRVARIRIKEIYAELPTTKVLAEQIEAERVGLEKNTRAVELRRATAELQELCNRLSKEGNQANSEKFNKLARSYELKTQETRALQQEFESFREEEEKRVARIEVASMRPSLNRILETARRISEERGYDLVLEDSGDSNTGLPFILYAKGGIDLTADVRAALQDAGKAAAKPEKSTKTEATKP